MPLWAVSLRWAVLERTRITPQAGGSKQCCKGNTKHNLIESTYNKSFAFTLIVIVTLQKLSQKNQVDLFFIFLI